MVLLDFLGCKFLHQRTGCLSSASCWTFLPWLLSVMDCDAKVEEKINPFLPRLPLIRAFCHGKAEASAGWYASTLAASRTATSRKNPRQAFSTSSLVLTLRSCWLPDPHWLNGCLSCVRMLSALSTVLSERRGAKSVQTPHSPHTLPYT